jgi:hypothetical protein
MNEWKAKQAAKTQEPAKKAVIPTAAPLEESVQSSNLSSRKD